MTSRPGLPPELVSRTLMPGDSEELASLDAEIFGREAWPITVIAEQLRSERVWSFGVVDKNTDSIVGAVALGMGIEAEILTISVREAWRGRGIGGFLLDAALERAKETGAAVVFLEVRSRAEAPQSLYRKAGFKPVGIRPNYYHDDDALLMRLILTSKI